MEYVTTGKQFNKGKIARVKCVENDPLQAVSIRDHSFLLLLLTKGTLQFEADNVTYHAVAPCFICFHEKTNPSFTKKPHTRCSAVYFHPTFLNCNMRFDLLRDKQYEDIAANHDLFLLKPFLDGPRIIPIAESALDSIIGTFHEMNRELVEQRDWYWSCRSRSYFMEMMIAVERMYGRMSYGEANEAPDVAVDANDARLKRALVYIESHYTESMDISDITAAVGVNRATLTRLFKEECGTTIAEYIKDYRLTVAQKQLLFTELPIKEIALRCGFKTVPHFGRCFKAKTGMTPAEYRKSEVMRRKADLRHEPPVTAEVVLDQLTGNHMYYLSREHFPLILKIGFSLECGDIRSLDSEERWQFFDKIDPNLQVRDFEREYLANVETLRAHAVKGCPVRIWRTRVNVRERCLFAYLCDILCAYDAPIEVVEHPDPELKWWGLIQEPFEDYLSCAKPLSKAEMTQEAALWHRLREENAVLRVLENGVVRSAQEAYYDDRLRRFLPTAQSGVAWIDDIAARPHEPEQFDWYLYRLQTFIKQGVLEYVPLFGVERSNIVRHKDAPQTVTMDDLRVIGHANMPRFPQDKPPHLPQAQVWVLLSAGGNVYVVQNDDIQKLLSLLSRNGETRIVKWVTMWWSGPREPDLPSYAARKALLELDPANTDTMLLLQGERQPIEKPMGETMPRS